MKTTAQYRSPRLLLLTIVTVSICIFTNYENHHLLSHGFLTSPILVSNPTTMRIPSSSSSSTSLFASTSTPTTADDDTNSNSNKAPAPVINGKRILPIKIMLVGLKGHQVAGAYAVLNSDYKKAKGEGWEVCQHIGTTHDLATTLQTHLDEYGTDRVSYIRALSFIIPNDNAMESIAFDWRKEAFQVNGKTNFDPVMSAMDLDDYLDDDDDDDDDDDEMDNSYFEMMTGAMSNVRQGVTSSREIDESATPTPTESSSESSDVVSPFDTNYASTVDTSEALAFNKENVDSVLDEIRPYLISDGGNVSVERVDEETKNVYLVLEGACGSCPSSTVTMQMGIERVLKENFVDLGEVLQVEAGGTEGEDQDPKTLSFQAVQKEVDRIKPAILAMGGLVKVIDVDPIGVVKLSFRGANKIKQGLELALLDIDFVKHIEFVMDE